jgi:hypothetical protein
MKRHQFLTAAGAGAALAASQEDRGLLGSPGSVGSWMAWIKHQI